MSKKKKRQTRKTKLKGTSQLTGSSKSSQRLDSEFNPDYSYVIKDLKRIGTLAGTFFIILIALSFLLN